MAPPQAKDAQGRPVTQGSGAEAPPGGEDVRLLMDLTQNKVGLSFPGLRVINWHPESMRALFLWLDVSGRDPDIEVSL